MIYAKKGRYQTRKKLKMLKLLNYIPLELLIWLTALVLLGFTDPEVKGDHHHFTLCPLANLGLSWCPGCGIGRSITQLMHGNFSGSFKQHWFGLPALLIINWRIVVLFRLNFFKDKVVNLSIGRNKHV